MSLYLGIDTSNYRTSAAVFDSEKAAWKNSGRLLDVPDGSIGLRQSDALFQHVVHLPERIAQLPGGEFAAAAASTRPRAVEGSYMPCFLAGEGTARSFAHLSGIPFYAVSHQQGHLAAAALSADALHLLREPFLAWHLSGGTTELLLVEPDEQEIIRARAVGGTNDLAAGQIIDRAGRLLHVPFPAGAQLEVLADGCTQTEKPFRPKVKDGVFSLSGVQNKVEQLAQTGASAQTVARYTIETIQHAVVTATEQLRKKYPLPVLCAGGVMSNRTIQRTMQQAFDAKFAQPELSGDNAVGVAVLAAIRNGEQL